MQSYGAPDHFNDDIQLYYLDQLADMLDGVEPLCVTNDHIQAHVNEVSMTSDKLTIHQKLSAIQQALKVPKSHYNEYSKFPYRSNDDIYEAVKPLCHQFDCVLTLNDEPVPIGQRVYIRATATINDSTSTFERNGYAREPDSQKGMSEGQVTGSASSYARKRALEGLFLLDNSQDIDSADNTHDTINTTPATPDPEITMILSMIDNRDLSSIQSQWNGLIGKHWASLDQNIKDKLNRLIETTKEG